MTTPTRVATKNKGRIINAGNSGIYPMGIYFSFSALGP